MQVNPGELHALLTHGPMLTALFGHTTATVDGQHWPSCAVFATKPWHVEPSGHWPAWHEPSDVMHVPDEERHEPAGQLPTGARGTSHW